MKDIKHKFYYIIFIEDFLEKSYRASGFHIISFNSIKIQKIKYYNKKNSDRFIKFYFEILIASEMRYELFIFNWWDIWIVYIQLVYCVCVYLFGVLQLMENKFKSLTKNTKILV